MKTKPHDLQARIDAIDQVSRSAHRHALDVLNDPVERSAMLWVARHLAIRRRRMLKLTVAAAGTPMYSARKPIIVIDSSQEDQP